MGFKQFLFCKIVIMCLVFSSGSFQSTAILIIKAYFSHGWRTFYFQYTSALSLISASCPGLGLCPLLTDFTPAAQLQKSRSNPSLLITFQMSLLTSLIPHSL